MKNRTILIIDDVENIAKSMSRVFRGEGLDTVICTKLEEAKEILDNEGKMNQIDGIVLDWNPYGPELLESIPDGTPLVIYTGRASEVHAPKADLILEKSKSSYDVASALKILMPGDNLRKQMADASEAMANLSELMTFCADGLKNAKRRPGKTHFTELAKGLRQVAADSATLLEGLVDES